MIGGGTAGCIVAAQAGAGTRGLGRPGRVGPERRARAAGPVDPPVGRDAGGRVRPRLPLGAPGARQLRHPAGPAPDPRRLLHREHDDLVAAAGGRPAGVGRPRGPRLGRGHGAPVLRAAAGADHAGAAAGPEPVRGRTWSPRPARRWACRSGRRGTTQDVVEGTGFFEIGYRPETNARSSSSICYLHPAQRDRANLSVLLRTRALRLILDGGNRAAGVLVRGGDGATAEVLARREVVVCAGAIDSPRLLQLSGHRAGRRARRRRRRRPRRPARGSART